MSPASIHVARLRVRPQSPWRLTGAGLHLRSALGPALRLLACQGQCADRDCQRPSTCPVAELYDGSDSQRPQALDLSALDEPVQAGDCVSIRLACVEGTLMDPLVHAARLALHRGLGPSDERVAFDVLEEDRQCYLPSARAPHITGPSLLTLLTPTCVTGWTDDSDAGALLKSIHERARQLEIALPEERFEPCLPAIRVFRESVQFDRYSGRQQGRYPIKGVRGVWRIEPDATQAWWLALGECLGVGKKTAAGMGVMRVERS